MSSSFERFEELQKDGKRLAAEGRLHESLHKFELARKIKETSKILNRIQKLKEVIGQIEKDEPSIKNEQSFGQKSSGTVDNSEKLSGILNQIQNIEVKHEKKVTSAEQSPGRLKRFNELKSRAIDLSYEGKFDESLRCFYEARKLRDCPNVKKYIQELESLVSKCPKKLEEFQNLTDTGKKLASAGKHAESLEKLKNAFAVCPSPAVSRMIKKIEAENPLPEAPVFSGTQYEDHLPSKNSDENADFTVNNTVFASSKSTDIHFSSSKAKSGGSSGSDFSLPSGSQSGISSANPGDLSPEARERFKHLYSQAKELARVGQLQEALDRLEEAKKMCPAERVLKRIGDLKEHMKQQESSDGMIEVSDGFFVYHEIYNKLYPYQREGVAWMWKLFNMKKGGVLGDDMGLGKTFEVIAFLSGLIDADRIKYALIIMPVSLLPNWEKEFRKWSPGISVSLFHGTSKRERERNLLRIQRRGHVLLTSYGMVINALSLLTEFEGRPFVWDYVILDEGHKIKNPTKTTKAVHAIPSKNRLVLTGTPIQNNLLELWALYDFVHQGTLLGSLKTFKMQYENTISRAREKDSTAGEKRLGTEMAENLKMLIKPYFLRRTKAEIWNKEPRTSDGMSDLEKEMEQLRISKNKLNTRKNDLIVWTFMSEAQCEIYRSFLHSEAVRTILVSKRSPLVELTTLKKICDHPRLLSQRACLQLGLNGDMDEEDLQRELNDESTYSSSIDNVTDEVLVAESGKMKFLIKLLENLKSEGHRTLVFSLSRRILDMINRILINRRWKVLRIDGTISKIEERERRIQLFQNDPSYSVFLLTTQVGGVGITLTAADRVVIYDPSWNPATDAQAVDRVYRIGQQNNVIVYRLITCGTVEEKIYRRQIFKDSITKQATGSSDPYRYFSKQELRELFTFEDPHHSATQVQLSQLHSHQRITDTQLDAHIAFLYSLDIFGVSDHDLMFSREIEDSAEDNEEAAVSHDYIKKQVAAAQVLIQTEASVVAEGIRLAGTFSRPFSEHVPVSKKNSETVAQMSKATPSASRASKPKVLLSSHFSGSDLRKNMSIHSPGLHKIDNYDKEIDDVFNSEKTNRRTSQISPNCMRISGQSGDEFVQKDIKKLSNVVFDASTPPLSERCNNISKYTYPTGSNKGKNMSPQHSESHQDSAYATNTISDAITPDLSARCNNISKYASPPGSNGKKNTSLRYSELQKDSAFETSIISKASTPPFENRTAGHCSNISTYATPTGSDRKKNSSLRYSELQKGSAHETNVISNANTPPPFENRTADRCSIISRYSTPRETNASLQCSESHKDSAHATEMGEDLDANEHIPVIELNSDDENENHDVEMNNSSTEGNQSIEILEETISEKSKSDVQSEHHSICETPAQASPKMDGDFSPGLPELDTSPVPPLESELDQAGDGMLVTSISDGTASPISCNQPAHSDSECSSDQKNAEGSFIHSRDLEATTDSGGSSPTWKTESPEVPAGEIATETSPLNRNGYSLVELGSTISLNGSACSFMADLSFDEKPKIIHKRRSCALPGPFVASDSDFSCSNSPSKEGDSEVLASTDSEDDAGDGEDSVSIVPSSIPNSPAPRNQTFRNRAESPATRRITPLKVRKSLCPPPDQAFAQALASSPVIRPPCYSSDSEVDSPVKVHRPMGRRHVIDSSEED
ncbi:DNA excision repair protein ERCC-6-like [Araneus ventricosus]|uniref:DNA repair and recombination protein RAD54-like n=1 Tax=Araneus ventricosus TaxID=182803 RepID=A0A4Y2I7I8_ARAVE|nr:DNA excision repair protein ERCC-6-like [Araneus ventricosus]